MKKLLLVIVFLGFFIGVISLTNYNKNKDEKTGKENQAVQQKNAELPLKAKTGTNLKDETLDGDHYVLWKNEAKSKSLYPKNLDQIKSNNANQKEYINNWFGYSFSFPDNWEVDNHQTPYYTRFYSKDFRIDITVQNVDKAWTNSNGYIKDTIKNLSNNITSDTTKYINGHEVRIVDYTRPLINDINNDMNYYSYYFVTNGNHVYTFQLKTKNELFTQKKNELDTLLSSFKISDMESVDLNSEVKKQDLNPVVKLKQDSKTLLIPKNSFVMGVYLPKPLDIADLSEKVDSSFGAQMFYKPIDSVFDDYVQQLNNENRLPMVTFLYERAGVKDNKNVVVDILKGKFDENLRNWADGIKKTQSPVLVRLGNEMNGNWSDWSQVYTYNDPDLYKLTFKHIVDLFRNEGADNAYFVWNPNHSAVPVYNWNDAHMFYPGDAYVNFVAMTSYNYGLTQWNGFQSFDTLYNDMYWDYSRSFAGKPLMIGEFGSVENGGNKPEWIKSFFNEIPSKYTNIKMVIWFNQPHAQFDLRIETSPQSIQAFKEGMKNPSVVKSLVNTK